MVTTANYPGAVEPGQGSTQFQSSKSTSVAITKGNVCVVSAGKWVKAGTGDTVGPFAVATKSAATSDTTVQLVKNGIVWVKAQGAIVVNGLVQLSAVTAASVAAYAATTVYSTTPTGTQVINAAADFSRVIGIYLCHENEGDGFTIPTDAVDGDTIAVLLSGNL